MTVNLKTWMCRSLSNSSGVKRYHCDARNRSCISSCASSSVDFLIHTATYDTGGLRSFQSASKTSNKWHDCYIISHHYARHLVTLQVVTYLEGWDTQILQVLRVIIFIVELFPRMHLPLSSFTDVHQLKSNVFLPCTGNKYARVQFGPNLRWMYEWRCRLIKKWTNYGCIARLCDR